MTTESTSGVPILETPRLRLRPYRADDASAMFALYSDPRVMRYWSFPPWTALDQARAYLDRALAGMDSGEIFPWAIAERESDQLIGALTLFSLHVEQLRAEVGYSLSPDSQGRGLAAEALRCGLACAIDSLGLVRVEADIDPRNEPRPGCWRNSASSAKACSASAGGSTAKLRYRFLWPARRRIRQNRASRSGFSRDRLQRPRPMTTAPQILEAVAALRRGEVIGLPTETVDGLAADASNIDAVRKIFALKGRPADHPLIVHIADASMLSQWASGSLDSRKNWRRPSGRGR